MLCNCTRNVADFIVATTVAAHRSNLTISDFHAENTLRLSLAEEQAKPDCAFALLSADGRRFNHVVELDNGTEPVYSEKQRDSLARKVRFYDQYQDQVSHRFRVLTLFAEPSARMFHFLQMVRTLVRNKQRRLFYAATLPAYLAADDAIRRPIFLDHHRQFSALVPEPGTVASSFTILKHLDQTLVAW